MGSAGVSPTTGLFALLGDQFRGDTPGLVKKASGAYGGLCYDWRCDTAYEARHYARRPSRARDHKPVCPGDSTPTGMRAMMRGRKWDVSVIDVR